MYSEFLCITKEVHGIAVISFATLFDWAAMEKEWGNFICIKIIMISVFQNKYNHWDQEKV